MSTQRLEDNMENHEHTHTHGGIDSVAKLNALLSSMHEHNVHHADELKGLDAVLEKLDKSDLSDSLKAVVSSYETANSLLKELIEKL